MVLDTFNRETPTTRSLDQYNIYAIMKMFISYYLKNILEHLVCFEHQNHIMLFKVSF